MRGGFWIKVALAAGLALVADRLFFGHEVGWTLGLFAATWVGALAIGLPAVRRHPAARGCLALAGGLALVLVDDPNPLAALLFLTAIASAAILPGAVFRDAGGWVVGGLVHAVTGLVRPVRDLTRLARVRRRRGGGGGGDAVRLLALPLLGGALFAALFAAANPIVAAAFGDLRLPFSDAAFGRLVLAGVVIALVWPTFRPGGWRPAVAIGERAPPVAIPPRTAIVSLLVFNAVFAVENVLDLAFLWSRAPLPAGVTLADYAHRGAYTLILTAILAGLFVLVTLHPGSAAASSRAVRRLLAVWIAQTLLLVASSMRRLADYVTAYALTELRIAAFAWMALVAFGLAIVGWRLASGRSARWLLNANAAAAAVLLLVGSATDLGAVAAAYNVRHVGEGAKLDLCYLDALGSSALLPVIALEARAVGALKPRIAGLRARKMARLAEVQADPYGWTWRGARRLAAARVAIGPAAISSVIPADDRFGGCPHARD